VKREIYLKTKLFFGERMGSMLNVKQLSPSNNRQLSPFRAATGRCRCFC